MQEEQQIVGAGGERLVNLGDGRAILADVAGAGGHRAIHADAVFVGAMPLAPAVALGGFDVYAVVIAGDIGEGLQAERSGVVLIGAPGTELQGDDGFIHLGVAAERQAGPLVGDAARGKIGIPGEPSVAVEVRLREVIAHPVFVQPHIDYADETAGGASEGFAGDERFHGRGRGAFGVHVEIQRLFPHGREEHGVVGLSEVFLGDLQFDRLVGLLQRAKQGRSGFAHLEIDGAVFDLHDHVVIELAVEVVEIVVGGAGAVVLGLFQSMWWS